MTNSEHMPEGRVSRGWPCATEGCGKAATEYFERGGVGSYHCDECFAIFTALTSRFTAGVRVQCPSCNGETFVRRADHLHNCIDCGGTGYLSTFAALEPLPAHAGGDEPVAWRWRETDEDSWMVTTVAPGLYGEGCIVEPLYLHPSPSAPRQGETNEMMDRDALGRRVREAWVKWALTQPNPKPSWLVPYDELSEPDKEADRQIGEALALPPHGLAGEGDEPVAWRPTYAQIRELVHACRERQKLAGEGDQMLSRWISEGLDSLTPSPQPTDAEVERFRKAYIEVTGSTMWPTDDQFRTILIASRQGGGV